MKIVDRAEHSDQAANPKEKPESCYCSALPKGSGLCLPCCTRWLAGRRRAEPFTFTLGPLKACAEPLLDFRAFEHPASETWPCLLACRVQALLIQKEVDIERVKLGQERPLGL